MTEFGTRKCATLSIKKEKIVVSMGIKLPDGEIMKSLKEAEKYMYLSIIQANQVKHTKKKKRLKESISLV